MNETTEKNIKNMMSLKKSYKHPDTVFLFVSDKNILTVGSDTDILARFTSVELRMTDGMKYGISPESELDNILPQLVKSGFRVAVCGAIEGENEQTTERPDDPKIEKSAERLKISKSSRTILESKNRPNDRENENPAERLDKLNMKLFRDKASERTMKRMNELEMLPEESEVNDWKSSFLGSFLRKNYKYYGIILQIEKIIGKRPVWADFTRSNIREIVEYYLSECAQSSARTYLALIKSALNDCENKEGIPCREYAAELSVKNIPSVAVYLTMEEIAKLENYKPESESERTILAQFLCSCFTGARHSDILQMTKENIHGKYISYISQKTKKKATIEMKKGLPKLLEQARQNKYADSTFNSTIREICRKAGINDKVRVFHAGKYESGRKYEFVTSHTGRRSFASNLAALGVPLRDISARMGHSSVTITERYILAPENKLSTTAMQYFR